MFTSYYGPVAILLAGLFASAASALAPAGEAAPQTEVDALRLSEEYKQLLAGYKREDDPDETKRKRIGKLTRQLLTWVENHGNDEEALVRFLGDSAITWDGWKQRNPREYSYLSYGVNRIYTVTLEKPPTPKPKRPQKIAAIRESYCFDLETGR